MDNKKRFIKGRFHKMFPMIYVALISYLFLSLIIAVFVRKFFRNIFLKRVSYAFFLSLFFSFWFLFPGSQNMAPILSIYLIDLLESESLIQMRLIRPFLLVFIFILFFDFILFRYKSKKK